MFIIQAISLTGKIVEKARWEVAPTFLTEGQTIQVNIPIDDADAMKFIATQGKQECSVEREGEERRGSANLTFVIKQVRHMLETEPVGMDTMVTVMPLNRTVDQVMLYIFDSSRCDERFMKAIRQTPR